MKLLKWLTGDNSKVERQIADAERNLAEAEAKYKEVMATLDGEEGWFVRLEKAGPTLRDIDRKVDTAKAEIMRKVETTCSQTI
jgi:hypothetical protein